MLNWYQLSTDVRDAIRDPDNEVYLSAISVWEAIVKYQLGKLPLPEHPQTTHWARASQMSEFTYQPQSIDTSVESDRFQFELLRQKTTGERFAMAAQMIR